MNYQEYRQFLNQKLAEKVQRELADFREDIPRKKPQEIYDTTYQIIIIVAWVFNANQLPDFISKFLPWSK